MMYASNGTSGPNQVRSRVKDMHSGDAPIPPNLAKAIAAFRRVAKQALNARLADPNVSLTRIEKDKGPVTKRLTLTPDGKIESDGSQCWIAAGKMERLELDDWRDFATHIEATPRNVAFALGDLRPGLSSPVSLVSCKDCRSAEPGFATRTQGNIVYAPDAAGFLLLDYDTKGMPPEVKQRLQDEGGFLGVLQKLCPGFRHAGYIRRASTSAGLYNKDTGEQYPGSGGEHIDLLVQDASDAKRFLYALHDRAWLAGFGWYIVGAAGQLLERTIVDRSVCAPERLVFEAAPDLEPPLAQQARPAMVHDGTPYNTRGMLDNTRGMLDSLNHTELQKLKKLKAEAGAALHDACEAARKKWINDRVNRGIDGSLTPETARHMVDALVYSYVLYPSVVLTFDEFGDVAVRDVLSTPSRFNGETLADPIEGIAYGRNKAKVYVQKNGEVKIHSFAHENLTVGTGDARSTIAVAA